MRRIFIITLENEDNGRSYNVRVWCSAEDMYKVAFRMRDGYSKYYKEEYTVKSIQWET